ncbi:MAG: hypothetical protein NT066_03670 [Candidatus Omnitrophica bacterium]|jgi:ATP-dependent RNA circularization protein (DNA/RNA ligase family)|nr:hypothetical protein [Candidatus Omnitrophota bacterium]
MAGRNDIEKRIEKERRQILELRNQIAHSEAFILGLQEALKLLPKEKTINNHAVSKLRDGSDVKKIYEFLLQVDKPLHIEEILAGIGKENTKINRLSITGSINKYVRDRKIFQRVGPNQFALIAAANVSVKDVVALPAEFGKDV